MPKVVFNWASLYRIKWKHLHTQFLLPPLSITNNKTTFLFSCCNKIFIANRRNSDKNYNNTSNVISYVLNTIVKLYVYCLLSDYIDLKEVKIVLTKFILLCWISLSCSVINVSVILPVCLTPYFQMVYAKYFYIPEGGHWLWLKALENYK